MARQPICGIDVAIAELGFPKTTWFRGHVAQHRLVPALFRFPKGVESERAMIDNCLRRFSSTVPTMADGLSALMVMQGEYLPTRLLAWTESLRVALFCALVRETDEATVFVLDPVALNADSEIAEIVKVGSETPSVLREFSNHSDAASLPRHPLAVRWCAPCNGVTADHATFTLHGVSRLALEEQCPACVRKVVLTNEEKALANEYVLSAWAP